MSISINKFLKGLAVFLIMLFLAYSILFSFNIAVFSKSRLKLKLVSFLKYSSVKPEFLKFVDFNFNTLTSDYFWTLFVQEASSFRLAKAHYPYMYKISFITVSLNPYFNYAYQAGGTLLGLAGKPKRAIKILKLGMAHLKGNWNIPFLLSFNYFYKIGNYKKAAYYLKYAVDMKGSPKYLEFLYIKLLNKSGSLKKTLSFLETMYKNNKNSYIKQIIQYRIDAVKNEMALKEEHKNYKIPYSLKLFMPQKRG